MAKPAIVAVDDDPQVAAAVARDLRARYAEDYRVVAATSGAEAKAAVEGLKARGDVVALFVADQRMPAMSGTEFLLEARPLMPDAKAVLLTAYADTEAAIQAINDVGLDYYLMKPWDPPEENLYPIIDDLLDDWSANVPPVFEGIRVVGAVWSPQTHDTKDFLARNQIPYRYLDVERDESAQPIVDAADGKVPVVLLPGGETLVQPERRDLAEKVGLRVEAEQPFYDVVIVGGGPAGLAAAVYGASEGLRTALIERAAPGGQAGTSSRIENYLGFPTGIAGGDLARRAVTQATRLGAELVTAVEVTGISLDDNVKVIELSDGSELRSRGVVIASGMTIRKLSVPGYERFEGAGVYYGAAPSEAATFRDQEVYVIGGANSAGQAAMMFSKTSKLVSLVVRGGSLEAKMSQYLVDQIAGRDNIEVLLNTQVVEVSGGDRVEQIVLRNTEADTEDTRAAAAIFIFVGAVPHSAYVTDLVRCNEKGFIFTGEDIFSGGIRPETWNVERDPFLLETSVPGIFAAGDIRHGAVRRVAGAVGQGSIAISFMHKYLETV